MLQRATTVSLLLFFAFLVSATALAPGLQGADNTATPQLPRVVIVGDSIRLSYASTVMEQLAGKAIVVSPEANGGDSSNLLQHLDRWVNQP